MSGQEPVGSLGLKQEKKEETVERMAPEEAGGAAVGSVEVVEGGKGKSGWSDCSFVHLWLHLPTRG